MEIKLNRDMVDSELTKTLGRGLNYWSILTPGNRAELGGKHNTETQPRLGLRPRSPSTYSSDSQTKLKSDELLRRWSQKYRLITIVEKKDRHI